MGFSIVSTVLSPAASIALTDLATAKDELQLQAGNTNHDTWLTRAIKRMSGMMANYTNRQLMPELVQDVIDIDRDPYPAQSPGGFSSIQLSRWPVLGVLSVVQTLSATQTLALTEGTDYRVDLANGMLLKLNPYTGTVTNWEASPVTVIFSAGYGALTTEAKTIPASTPWQLTANNAATFSCDHKVSFSSGTALTRVASTPAAGQYSVSSAGVYTFASADASKAVNVTYAQRVVPDDLADICLRLVVARFKSRGRDPMLMQRDTPELGTERFWVGTSPKQDGPFPPDITSALDTYRVPVLA
jgi:hypothetical protein